MHVAHVGSCCMYGVCLWLTLARAVCNGVCVWLTMLVLFVRAVSALLGAAVRAHVGVLVARVAHVGVLVARVARVARARCWALPRRWCVCVSS